MNFLTMNRNLILNSIKIISICLFISYTNYSYAFLWENLWLDLYDKIDSWIVDLEQKNFKYVMVGENWSINQELNRILKTKWIWECLNDEELTLEEVQEIADYWNIKLLAEKINNNCKSNEWIIIANLAEIQKTISEIKSNYTKMAEEKTKQMYLISNIWIYSDGNLENSWFDLINDLQEINKIIFSNEVKYIWENITSWDSVFNKFLKEKEKKYTSNNLWKSSGIKKIGIGSSQPPTTPPETQVCSQYNWNSWLNRETTNDILSKLNQKYWYKNDENTGRETTPESQSQTQSASLKPAQSQAEARSASQSAFGSSSYYDITPTWYQWVSDNSFWSCNDNVFCISINFKMYNHKLLWFWDSSIEWLLKRSNDHLKKFAWSFMWQASMTSWFFECSTCRNLNFWDMFHMWLQVTSKPVPFLDLKKEDDKKNDKNNFFKVDNLLTQYYKERWIEYNRANDLTIYNKEDLKKKALLDSDELTITDAANKENELKKYDNKENLFTQTAVNKKLLSDDMANFYNQFTELEMHAKTMLNYTDSMQWILEQMKKTPVHN